MRSKNNDKKLLILNKTRNRVNSVIGTIIILII